MKVLRQGRLIIIGALIGGIALLWLLSGYLLKRYIEENSEAWIGRKIKIASAYVNPFSTSVWLNQIDVLEQEDEAVFLHMHQLHLNAIGYKLLLGEIIVEEIAVKSPEIVCVQTGEKFNFDDLIERFTTDDTLSQADQSESTAYTIRNIHIDQGSLRFHQSLFETDIVFKDINARCPIVSSTTGNLAGDLSFSFSTGGQVNTSFDIQMDSLTYHMHLDAKEIALGFVLPFIDDVMYVTAIQGFINSEMILGGDFSSAPAEVHGYVHVDQFQLLDTASQPVMAVQKLAIHMDTIRAVEGEYIIDKVALHEPYLHYEMTPTGNNLLRFTEPDSTIADSNPDPNEEDNGNEYLDFFKLLTGYFVELGQAYAIRYYAIDSLVVDNGKFLFNDYTLNQKFEFLLEEVMLTANTIHSDQDSIRIKMTSRMNHSGFLDAALALMPKDTGDLKLDYSIRDLKIVDFSPYSEYYVAHPFWSGSIFFESHTVVKDLQLDSKNRLFITDLEVGDKVKNQTAYNLPLKLAVSLLKDVHGNVDLKIPLRGNVNDPKFKFFPVVIKILKDLIVKAAATPYKLLARAFNAPEEDLKEVKYDYLQSDVQRRQKKSLTLLTQVMNQKKNLQVRLVHINNAAWEIDQYALFEAKLRYYQSTQGKELLNEEDSIQADRIPRLDSAFMNYLSTQIGRRVSADVETECVQWLGRDSLVARMEEVNNHRLNNLKSFLSEKGDMQRIIVEEAKPEDKQNYRDRPKFVVLFEAGPSTQSKISSLGE